MANADAAHYPKTSAVGIAHLLAVADTPLTVREIADLTESSPSSTQQKVRRMFKGGLVVRRERSRERTQWDHGGIPYEYTLSPPGHVRLDGGEYPPTSGVVLLHRIAWAPRPISSTAVLNTVTDDPPTVHDRTGAFTYLYRAGYADREKYPAPYNIGSQVYKYTLADPTADEDDTDT